MSKMSEARLKEIRTAPWTRSSIEGELLAHIDALQAEVIELKGCLKMKDDAYKLLRKATSLSHAEVVRLQDILIRCQGRLDGHDDSDSLHIEINNTLGMDPVQTESEEKQ